MIISDYNTIDFMFEFCGFGIDTTKCQNIDTIKSKIKTLMPEFYPYLNQTTRKISYPYNYLPIFISKDRLGSQFINIDATGLKMAEMESLANVIHKLYEYPFYYIYNKLSDCDPTEKLFQVGFSEITDNIELNFKKGKKRFNNSLKPQDVTLPKKYYKMMNLLHACCQAVSDFLDYWDDGQFLYQLEELIDKAFLPENLSDCNSDNKIQSDFDSSDHLELMSEASQDDLSFIKVLKYIYAQPKNVRPQNQDDADSVAFLYEENNFNAICFRKKFFEHLVKILSINNYDWNKFCDNCRRNNLTENNKNSKDINIKVDGKSVKFFGLNKDSVNNYLFEHSD